ncbi:hypothetical protein ACHAPT_009057 [Fusarium lateritium]
MELRCIRKRLRFRDADGNEIITCDLFQKMACSIEQFKQGGHVELQADAINASFPWAAIRFLLRTSIDDVQEYGLVVSDLERIAHVMTKCYQIEHQYLQDSPPTQDALKVALTRLYAEILTQFGRMIGHYRAVALDTMTESDFCPGNNTERIMSQARDVSTLAHPDEAYALRFPEPTFARSCHPSLVSWQTLTAESKERLGSWLSPLPLSQTAHDAPESGEPSPLLHNPQFRSWHTASSSSVLLVQAFDGWCLAAVANLSEAAQETTSPAPFAHICCAEMSSGQEVSTADAIMRTVLAQLLTHRSDETKIRKLLWADFERRSALARVRGQDLARLRSHECVQLILELAEEDALTIAITGIDRLNEADGHNLIEALECIAANSGNVAKILVACTSDVDVLSALAQHLAVSRASSSTSVENRVSFDALLFTGSAEMSFEASTLRPEEHILGNASQAETSGASEQIAVRLAQGEESFQTFTDYELAILNATEAGSVAGLERLENSSFYPQLFSAASKDKVISLTRQAIQAGHIDILAWYLKTSSQPSNILPEDAVATAVLYSDLAMVRYLVGKGMGIETEGRFGSPLVTASLLNRHAIAQVLVQLGAGVNAKGTFGSALDIAALKGHNSIINMLLGMGANIHQKGGPFGTVLQAAAFHGHLDTVKLLLDAGAKDDLPGYCKDEFHAAIEGGHPDIVLLLLERGHRFRFHRLYGKSCNWPYRGPKDHLREASPTRAAREWSDDQEYDDEDEEEDPEPMRPLTDLDAIFKADQLARTRDQTSAGEPNGRGELRDFKYDNPLDSAARVGQTNVIELMLNLDALGLSNDEVGQAATVAAERGHFKATELLLKHLATRACIKGYLKPLADASCKSKARDSLSTEQVLAIAGQYCSFDELEKLKAEPPTFTQRYEASDDLTPESVFRDLKSACTHGKLDELSVIINSGHAGQLKPEQLTEALQRCAMCGHPSLLGFLFEFLLNSDCLDDTVQVTDNCLVGAAASGHLDIVKLLISMREATPFTTKVVGGALVNACQGGHDHVSRYLIQDMSADVNQLALDRPMTPLTGRFAQVRAWLPSQSSPDTEHSLPTTSPLQAALRGFRPAEFPNQGGRFNQCNPSPQSNPDQIVKVLLDLGANPNDLGSPEMYPIQAAAEFCPPSVVRQLIEAGADVNLALGEDSSIFKAAGRELLSGEILRILVDAGATLPDQETATNRLFEKPLAYFDDDTEDRGHGIDSDNDGFELDQSMDEIFEKGPGAAISTLMALYPQHKASDTRYWHVLQMAAFLNNHALVAMLLSRGVNVNGPGHYYGTALQAAARCGHQDMVLQLLNAGAQINILQGEWQTALRAAIVGGHEAVVRTLLYNGADHGLALKGEHMNPADKLPSCLQLAVKTGKVEIVNALLEHGADDDSARLAGTGADVDQPPLILSAERGNMAITKALLDSGADVNVQGRKPYNQSSVPDKYASPLSAAITNKHRDVVVLLLEHGADANQVVGESRTPLFLAADRQDQFIVRFLLKYGADVNYQVWCGTALTAAAEHDHLGIVQDLLAAGAKVSIGQGFYRNPFREALRISHSWETKNWQIAEVLFETLLETKDPGPDIEEALPEAVKDRNSKTVDFLLDYLPISASRFRQACAAGAEQAVRRMLQRGVSPNEVGDDGDYPFHVAAAHLQPTIVDILIQHGVDVNATNREGKTPIQAALEVCAAPRLDFPDPGPMQPIRATMTRAKARRRAADWPGGVLPEPPTIGFPMFRRCEHIVAMLLNNGASLGLVAGSKAGPPLHVACLIGSKPTVLGLLQKGANVNEIGGHFKHVLFIAIVTSRPDLVALLLQHGADPNYLHEYYGTPLHLASKLHAKLSVKQLLKHGADAAKRDSDGKLPLEILLSAQQGRKTSIASLLKAAGGNGPVTEEALLEAARSHGSERLFELLEQDKAVVVSEKVVIAAITSYRGFGHPHFGKDIDRLMKRTGDLGVTENMLRSAQGYHKFVKLVEFRPLCNITLELLLSLKDARSLKLLLEANPEIPVTESLVIHVLHRGDGYNHSTSNSTVSTLLEMLWERNPNIVVTPDIVAAAKVEPHLKFILEHTQPGSITITEKTITTILESNRQVEMMKLLLQYDPSIRFTPSQARKMLVYVHSADGLEVMLSHDPAMAIGEELFLAFFGVAVRDRTRMQMVGVLKRYNRKLVFTQKMRDAVDETYQYEAEKGKRELMYSLREKDLE